MNGRKLLEHKDDPLATRNRIATAMFTAWWFPFSRFGVIHGDPHLGNYTVFEGSKGKPAGINLLDYGCIRIFPPSFVGGVVDLYRGLLHGDNDLVVHAYETWGFKRLSRELIDALNIWARFIYGPLLDDRVRSVADGVKPSEYGRKEAFRVHQARPSALAPSSCTSRRNSISIDCSMRRSRVLRSTRWLRGKRLLSPRLGCSRPPKTEAGRRCPSAAIALTPLPLPF
jgi:hypothetical protein